METCFSWVSHVFPWSFLNILRIVWNIYKNFYCFWMVFSTCSKHFIQFQKLFPGSGFPGKTYVMLLCPIPSFSFPLAHIHWYIQKYSLLIMLIFVDRLWVEGSSRKSLCCIFWLELQWHLQICGENGGGTPALWGGWWSDLAHEFLNSSHPVVIYLWMCYQNSASDNTFCPIFAHWWCLGTVGAWLSWLLHIWILKS